MTATATVTRSGLSTRAKLAYLALAVVAVVGVTSVVVLPARAEQGAAREAAQRYVDLVASGDEEDLERLWATTVSESPGALRTAGALLVDAEERIEVVSVGEPREIDPVGTPYQVDLEQFVEVEVRYRLAGEERRWPIALGAGVGEGSDIDDWRVVSPLVGAIAWDQPVDFTDLVSDAYVGGVRQVRRFAGDDEREQPLYPAGYATQSRLAPYFASSPTTVVVTAGEPVAAPELPLDPTARTRDLLRGQVVDQLRSCSGGNDSDALRYCPFYDIAQRAGVDIYRDTGWWRGLSRVPTITVARDGLTLTDGAIRLRGPQGVRTVRFSGTGSSFIDNQAWVPVLSDLDLREGP